MTKANVEDFMLMTGEAGSSSKLVKNVEQIESYIYHFNEEMYDVGQYQELIDSILTCPEETHYTFMFSCCGGSVEAAIAIVNAMNMSGGTFTGVLTTQASSAATIVLLACDQVSVMPDSYMMLHAVSYGVGGKMGDVKASSGFIQRTSEKLLKDTYKHFLTSSEIDMLIDGKDYWMDSDEVVDRLNKRAELFNSGDKEDVPSGLMN